VFEGILAAYDEVLGFEGGILASITWYYRFADFRKALEEITTEGEKRAAIARIFEK
jgi:hypothetical protein